MNHSICYEETEIALPPCSVSQEKSQKMLRLGVALVTVGVTLISAFLALWVAVSNPQTKAWFQFRKKQNRLSSRFPATLQATSPFWWSPNKMFALGLIPDLQILNFNENPNPEENCHRSHWRLGLTADILGRNPTLHFNNSTGILELKSNYDFIVWSSESTPSQEYKAKKDLDYFQGIQYHVDLTDEGILEIVGFFPWQPEVEKRVIWQSNRKCFSLLDETNNCRLLRTNHVFLMEHPLFNGSNSYHLLFDDVVGMLQLWGSKRGQLLWQSHQTVLGEAPWFCVMSDIGALVILDRHRTTIWSSTYVSPDITIQPRNQLNTASAWLKVSDEGQIQLLETNLNSSAPYWHSSTIEIPDWLHQDQKLGEGKPHQWYLDLGYKRIMDRLCLIGNDVLVSHQKLLSLTDPSFLQLQPHPESRFQIRSYLRLDNNQACVYYVILLQPLSIFSDDLLNSNPDLAVTHKILSSDQTVKDTDRPLILYVRKKFLYLTTFHGQIIAKKDIVRLTEQLKMTS